MEKFFIFSIWKRTFKQSPVKLSAGMQFKLGDLDVFEVLKINFKDKPKNTNLISEPEKYQENEVCSICYENKKNTILWPCKHVCSCAICSKPLERCPICRSNITSTSFIND
jgi:rubrerythrin